MVRRGRPEKGQPQRDGGPARVGSPGGWRGRAGWPQLGRRRGARGCPRADGEVAGPAVQPLPPALAAAQWPQMAAGHRRRWPRLLCRLGLSLSLSPPFWWIVPPWPDPSILPSDLCKSSNAKPLEAKGVDGMVEDRGIAVL
ncbi:unnamed protein product [Urochloa humidicola]